MPKNVRLSLIEAIETLEAEGSIVTIGNIAEVLNVSLSEAHMMMGKCIGKEKRGISKRWIDCIGGYYLIKED